MTDPCACRPLVPPRRGRGRRRTGAALLAAAAWSAAPAAAQGFRDFELSPFSGHLRLTAEYWDESQENAFRKRDETERTVREELMLRTRGFYYHPKLVEFDLRGVIGLEQSDIDVSDGIPTRSINTSNLGFDLRALFFKDNAYSADLYAFRNETRTRQSFFNTTEADVWEAGANLHAKEWWLPTRLHVDHHEYRGRGLDTYRESRDTVQMEGRRQENEAQYQYSLKFDDVELGTGTTQAYHSFDAFASMTRLLGDDQRDRWHNNVRLREQDGSVSSSNFGATSSYAKYWSDSLSSNHSAQLSRTSTSGADTDTLSASSGLTHQLYESLTSSLTARTSTTEIDQGGLDLYGALAQVNYRKKTPIGRLNLRGSYDFYIQDQDALGGLVAVGGEPHDYQPGLPILLQNPFVVHSTVVVFDDTGLRLEQGDDYVLVLEGDFTRVDIPVTSDIAPADTFTVDYAYTPVPAERFRNDAQTYDLSLAVFEYADLSLGYGTVDQELLSGFETGTLQDSRRTRAGARVYPFGATLGAEYENYDAEISPLERSRAFASYQRPLSARIFWRIAASTFRTRFKEFVQRERGTNASTSLNARISPRLLVELRAEYRAIKYRTDEGDGMLLEGSLRRKFRSVEMTITARYSDEQFELADDRRIASLILSLTRSF